MALGRVEAAAERLGERVDQRGKIERGVDLGGGEMAHVTLASSHGGGGAPSLARPASASARQRSASTRLRRAARR